MAEKDFHKYEITFKATKKTLEAFIPVIQLVAGLKDLKIVKKRTNLTNRQTKALHLWFEWLAKELNNAGWDTRKTLRQDIDIPWTAESIKRNIWKPLQKAKYDTTSIRQLKREQIDEILKVIIREIGTRTKIDVPPFPSQDLLQEISRQKNLAQNSKK